MLPDPAFHDRDNFAEEFAGKHEVPAAGEPREVNAGKRPGVGAIAAAPLARIGPPPSGGGVPGRDSKA